MPMYFLKVIMEWDLLLGVLPVFEMSIEIAIDLLYLKLWILLFVSHLFSKFDPILKF